MTDFRSHTTIPAKAGIGLRHPHFPAFLSTPQPVSWLEVHSENYLAKDSPRTAALERLRNDYPLSCHGVGLSLGSAGGLDQSHLVRLRALYDQLEPGLVSEHLSWSTAPNGAFLNDLLPLPYTNEALNTLTTNVNHAQEVFNRQLLIENPSTYLHFQAADWDEAGFLGELVKRTGCGLLLDVNNLHVCAANHGGDPLAAINRLPLAAVGEIHIAGHARVATPHGELLIDDHGSKTTDAVWQLLASTLHLTGARPVLVEWDTNVPELSVLLAEAERASFYLQECSHATG